MAKFLFVSSCLLGLSIQINSQIIRSPSFLSPRSNQEVIFEFPRNYVDYPRNYIDIPRNYLDIASNFINVPRIIETPRNLIQPQPTIIAEPPLLPITNLPNLPITIPAVPSTTVISDCTPSVCQNLADTINLMIVSNLLQNSLPDLRTLKMVAPFLKNGLSKIDTFNPNFATFPGPINPNFIAPNVIPPRLVANTPVAPNPVAPSLPIGNSAMISSLLKLLGNTV